MEWLIVGLGNPGSRYDGTRHNIGFEVVDELRSQLQRNSEWKNWNRSVIADGFIEDVQCALMKPTTFMNASGEVVGEFVRYFKVPVKGVVVIHDDLDLGVGTVRVKSGGGDGGHNGLKSITACLNSAEFARIRLGIGRPVLPPEASREGVIARWVLERFSGEEQGVLAPAIARATDAARKVVTEGIAKAQRDTNGQ